MKIYIIDIHKDRIEYFQSLFQNEKDVECVCSEFSEFMENYDVECVVSPANAFGLMDGGYDLAITKYFGNQLQKRVQQYIIDNFYGEQPVGTSFIIDAGKDDKTLIHTPSMRVPQLIKDPLIVYYCMRSTLMCAYKNNVKSILIPLFGCGTGFVSAKIAAEMMWCAYRQIKNPPQKLDWNYALKNSL